MKSLKFFCIIFFCFGFIIVSTQCNTERSDRQGSATPLPTNYEQRNLTTPLSRLWGQWIGYGYQNWYFSKVTKPGEVGTLVQVNPDRETFIKYVENEKKNGRMAAQEANKMLSEVDEIAGIANYSKYQLVSQEPNGIKIVIHTVETLASTPLSVTTECNMEIHIDKDGKKMKWVASINANKRTPINPPVIYTFVNTKTSPEE